MHKSIEGSLLSTLHFLQLVPDPNPRIAAKLGQDYNHAPPPDSIPTEGQVYTQTQTSTSHEMCMCVCQTQLEGSKGLVQNKKWLIRGKF